MNKDHGWIRVFPGRIMIKIKENKDQMNKHHLKVHSHILVLILNLITLKDHRSGYTLWLNLTEKIISIKRLTT